MRDILFRAKLKDTNYWAEGFYCSMRETTYCCEEDYKRHPVPLHHLIAVDEMTDWGMPNRLRLYEINPETLCQYTGLCDKNGKKIQENDIVQYGEYTAVVRYGKYTAGFYVDFPEETNYRKDLGYWYEKVSVIGNVLEDTKGNRLESHTVSESGWIPVTERLPENDDYVLLSFENFSLPLVGRYVDDEKLGGAWYLGDCFDEDTCLANDLFVNAWMPLPEPYREDEQNDDLQ